MNIIYKKLKPRKFGIHYDKKTRVFVIGLYFYAVAFDLGKKKRQEFRQKIMNELEKQAIKEANRFILHRARLRKKNRRKK